jgi:hypothetical protein
MKKSSKVVDVVISKSYSPDYSRLAGEWLLDHGADPAKVKLHGGKYDRRTSATVLLERWDPLLVKCVSELRERAGNVYVAEAHGPFVVDTVQDQEVILHRDSYSWVDHFWREEAPAPKAEPEVKAPVKEEPNSSSAGVLREDISEHSDDYLRYPCRDAEALRSSVGKRIIGVQGLEKGSDLLVINTEEGALTFRHYRDCCESAAINDFEGDPEDLIDGIIVVAEENSSDPNAVGNSEDAWDSSHTWTFYSVRTTKGDLWVRWLGCSNGYYSEAVTAEWLPTVVSN